MVIKENYPLKNLNTFQVDVSAKKYIEISDITDLKDLGALIHDSNDDYMILGRGSNVLFTKDFDGLIIRPMLKGTEIIDEDDENVIIESAAGEIWDEVVTFAVENGFGGIENLTSIPGMVGAAPIQNIGAYGVELKDVFQSLHAVELDTGSIHEFSPAMCRFGYRDSIFKGELKNKFMIISVRLNLKKNPRLNIAYKDIMAKMRSVAESEINIKVVRNVIHEIRSEKLADPAVLGNAGSFFKNPIIGKSDLMKISEEYTDVPHYAVDDAKVKIPAAWLIDKCGLKGLREGDVGTHVNQPLVIVNYGNASGQMIKEFSEKVSAAVKYRFGIQLYSEVNII
ncbi:MAG: UDP-N-acetylmuramate dehydrogenase [Melioribacteraceae bacterium]|nr:UDP-N-acetylmuramate dehydrogenase [Melioribacteraceae bacterium]